jgi:hypothetical protein
MITLRVKSYLSLCEHNEVSLVCARAGFKGGAWKDEYR